MGLTTGAASPARTMRCRGCATEVPMGEFCGLCGCDQSAARGNGRRWLRPATFAAAPAERVLRPYVTSTLFPRLARPARTPFRIAMAAAVLVLFGLAMLRMPGAEITVAALGLPLLFILYLHDAGADEGNRRYSLILAAVLGAGLGSAWVLGTDQWLVLRFTMSESLAPAHLLDRLARFSAVLVLMILPAVVVRLLRPATRESLDGFAIGALGAMVFTAAATLTRLAPQFTTGLIDHERPVQGLAVQAGLSGLTIPITAAAAGGMTGILLWFRHPGDDDAAIDHPGRVRVMLAVLVAGALLAQASLVVVDIAVRTQIWILLLHIGIAALVLVGLRAALQLALLHEDHGPIDEDARLVCRQCGQDIPAMPFCPACGAAVRASSHAVRRPRAGRLVGQWGIIITAAAATLSAVGLALTPEEPNFTCPPDCGRPVSSLPFARNPRFTAADGTFSVAHPAPGTNYRVTLEEARVTATLTVGDGGVMQFFAEPAKGRSARDVAKSIVKNAYPEAVTAYEIPNAMVGYQPGYGEVDDDWPTNSSVGHNRIRILVMVAVKHDLALITFAVGPFHEFRPDSGPGRPSGANLQIAEDMGQYVNSFTWRGDPLR